MDQVFEVLKMLVTSAGRVMFSSKPVKRKPRPYQKPHPAAMTHVSGSISLVKQYHSADWLHRVERNNV